MQPTDLFWPRRWTSCMTWPGLRTSWGRTQAWRSLYDRSALRWKIWGTSSKLRHTRSYRMKSWRNMCATRCIWREPPSLERGSFNTKRTRNLRRSRSSGLKMLLGMKWSSKNSMSDDRPVRSSKRRTATGKCRVSWTRWLGGHQVFSSRQLIRWTRAVFRWSSNANQPRSV